MSFLNYRNYGRLWRVYGRSVVRYGTARKAANALRTEWAYRRRRSDVPSRPYLLFVEPIYACNLACPLCDRQTRPARPRGRGGRLSLELYDRILDEVGDDLFQCHIFGLGEPTLDWPLTRSVIERTHRRRIFTLMSTNCTLFTPEMAEGIVDGPLDHLVCAIDGVSQAAYRAYRVGGDAEQAIQGLRHVVDARRRRRRRGRLTVQWQVLVHRHNRREMDAGLQRRWLPEGGSFADAKLTPGEPMFRWPCYWLWHGAVVNSNGRLARCPGYHNAAECGSLHERSLMSIYDGETSRRARKLFSRRPDDGADYPRPCTNFSFYERAHGGPYLSKAGAAQGGTTGAVAPLSISCAPAKRPGAEAAA